MGWRMNKEAIVHPDTQKRVRSIINRIMIEKQLNLKALQKESGVGFNSVHEFVMKNGDVGITVMRKLLGFVLHHGYNLNDIIFKG